MSAARPGKIQHGVDRQREHRAFDEIAALATEHRSRFGMFAKQACIDQRRQILATLRGQLEASMNEIGQTAAPRAAVVRQVVSTSKKKSRAKAPLKNCVDPLSPKVRFIVAWRGDAASARQGSSRDLDHQTVTLRVV